MTSKTEQGEAVCTPTHANSKSAIITLFIQPLAPQPLGTPDLSSLERFRQVLAQPVLASFIAGGVAGAVSRTVVSPLERLKILFQVQSVGREEYKMSVPKALAKMWREEGWRGFMAGNGTNCIRIVPYSAVQFSAYNVYKKVSKHQPQSDGLGETPHLRSSWRTRFSQKRHYVSTDKTDRLTSSSSSRANQALLSAHISGSCAVVWLASPPSPSPTHLTSFEHDYQSNLHPSQV